MNKKSRKHFARPALCSIALALSLSVSGCGLSSSVTRMGSADVGTKIYVIGQSKSIEFWEKVKQGAIEAGEELGYDVVYTSADSVADIDGQKKLIHEAINAGAQTIVIAPNDPEKLNEDLQEAVDAGIDILTIDSDANFDGRSAYIGTINASSGAIAARHALEYLSDYYNDKVLVVRESDSLAIGDRLSGFLPALIGGVKSSAAVKYADIIAANAQAELEGATDIPESILGPARGAAAAATANNAPEEAVARAVANAVAAPAKAENIDVQIAARAAKLAVDAQGGNGDLAAKLTRELMTGSTGTDSETPDENAEPTYNSTEEVEAKVNAAAQAAAKAAAGKGASAAEIADAAAQAAIETALELGAGPGTAAKAAGQAAGMNGGDSIAASSAASAAVDEANRKNSAGQGGAAQQGGAPEGAAQQGGAPEGAAQQGGAPEGAAQQGGPDASVEVPAELATAAQQAAKTAAANGAPADAIAQAAAEAAASAAIEMGASPAAAGQAAGQAAGMNGGNAQLAGSTAAQTVAKALAEGGKGAEGAEGGEGAQKPDDAQQGETPASTGGLPSINSINPIAGILNCKGLAENAKAEITQMLSTKDGSNIKVIFATSENSTLGACQAISDLGLVGKVAIVGYNSSENELTYMKNGTLSGLILQNPYNMGYLGVYYAGRLKVGENVNQMVDTGATYASLNNLNSDEIKLLLDPAEFTKK